MTTEPIPEAELQAMLKKACETCKGQGGWFDADGEPSTCDDCGGSGHIEFADFQRVANRLIEVERELAAMKASLRARG